MVRYIRFGVCAMLMPLFAAILFAASWMGGRGPGNSGAYPDTPFPDLPSLVWKTSLGEAYSGKTPSNGVIAGNMFVAAFGEKLVGISAETGEVRWNTVLPDTPLDGILLLNNKVIVSTAAKGVFAFNPNNGALIWQRELFNNITNGPLASESSLVYTTKSASLDVIDPENGKQISSVELHDEIEAAPLRIGSTLFLCFQSGRIVRISGTLDSWTGKLPRGDYHFSPVQSGHFVIICSNSAIYSINVGSMDNSVAWSYPCRDLTPETVTLAGTTVYFATTGGRLQALDVYTGREKWGENGIALPAPAIASPLLIGDRLFVCMKNGLLATYDKNSGALSWSYRLAFNGKTADATAGLPVVVGNHLFFATSDGSVYHLSNLMPDADPPTFRAVLPTVAGSDFSNATPLKYVGAIIEDEGSGVKPGSITMRLDGVDLTPQIRYDLASGYSYAALPAQLAMTPGMHRLEMNATDFRDNKGVFNQLFFVGNSSKSERLQITINAQYLPSTLKVRAGTTLQWINYAGSLRSVVADDGSFTSDTIYPRGIPDGESWAYIVPATTPTGTKIYYHCRLLGSAGDGTARGTGLAGEIEVVDPRNPGPGFPDLDQLTLPDFPRAPF